MKLKIVDLCVEIDKKIILDKFNLNIGDGEIHAIMGPNGVGKSTLSRVIMGDNRYQVIDGDILVNDESIVKMTVDERSKLGIFLAMQSPQEIEGISNQDFLRTAMSQKEQKKVNLFEFINSCEKAVYELEMNKELIHRSLNVGFSGGEKKKNEVLQIKLLKPSLIILDELDSGLDVDSLRIVCNNLKEYLKENRDTSVIIITHYSMILDYINPDYIHILANKKLVKTGTADLIKDIEKNGYNKYLNDDSVSRNDTDE